jgi:uncharacterized protein
MNYTKRAHEQRIFSAFKGSMITGILGPRRVGKSTLVDHYINQYPDNTVVRLNMDKMSVREQVKAGKLETLILTVIQRHLQPKHRVWVTIDEAQKCPEVFDQIKVLYDQFKDQDAIKFILTGSAFSLSEAVKLQYDIDIHHNIFDLIDPFEVNENRWREYFHYLIPYSKRLKEALVELLIWGGLPEVLMLSCSADRLDYLATNVFGKRCSCH